MSAIQPGRPSGVTSTSSLPNLNIPDFETPFSLNGKSKEEVMGILKLVRQTSLERLERSSESGSALSSRVSTPSSRTRASSRDGKPLVPLPPIQINQLHQLAGRVLEESHTPQSATSSTSGSALPSPSRKGNPEPPLDPRSPRQQGGGRPPTRAFRSKSGGVGSRSGELPPLSNRSETGESEASSPMTIAGSPKTEISVPPRRPNLVLSFRVIQEQLPRTLSTMTPEQCYAFIQLVKNYWAVASQIPGTNLLPIDHPIVVKLGDVQIAGRFIPFALSQLEGENLSALGSMLALHWRTLKSQDPTLVRYEK